MGIKWNDYLKRKGLNVQEWIRTNKIRNESQLRSKISNVGIVVTPDEFDSIMEHTGASNWVGEPLDPGFVKELAQRTDVREPVVEQRVRRKVKRREPEVIVKD